MTSVIVYDGSFKGLLSAVFYIYEHKIPGAEICKKTEAFQAGIFGRRMTVETDTDKAERIWNSLQKKLSRQALYNIYLCYLSEIESIENSILNFIQLAFSFEQSIEQAYTYSSVLKISQVSKMVGRERHRMEAFVRFQLTSDEIYFAVIEPDFNVIPILVKHFKNRYADQRWIIYDLKRKYGIYYDLETVTEIEIDFSEDYKENASLVFNESEEIYQVLWRDYFQSVNISARKNTKLHIRHVPKRYWKGLTEKQQ